MSTSLDAAPVDTNSNGTTELPSTGRPIDSYVPCVPPPAIPSVNTPTWAHKACRDVPISAPIAANRGPYAAAAMQAKLWGASGTDPTMLNYFFLGGTDVQKQKVQETIREWELYAHVQFQESHTIAGTQIRIDFDPHDGSWSVIGKDAKTIPVSSPTMNLAWVDRTNLRTTPEERGSILHEFGHALGLMHEHQSPGRTGLFLDENATMAFYQDRQGWSEDMIREQIINVYNTRDVSAYSSPDVTSIMQYPLPSELSGHKYPIPYNSELSDLDKAYITINYPQDPHPSVDWSLEKALAIAGVNTEDAAKIRTSVAAGDVRNARVAFLGGHFSKWHEVFDAQDASTSSTVPESMVERAFVQSLTELMEFLPDIAKPQAANVTSMDAQAIFDDSIHGPVTAELLSKAVIALNTRARHGPTLAKDFRDIFTHPIVGPMLGELLTFTVSTVKDSIGDGRPQNSFGLFDVLKHSVFGQVSKTLLNEAVDFAGKHDGVPSTIAEFAKLALKATE